MGLLGPINLGRKNIMADGVYNMEGKFLAPGEQKAEKKIQEGNTFSKDTPPMTYMLQ